MQERPNINKWWLEKGSSARNIPNIAAEFVKDALNYMIDNPDEILPVVTVEMVKKWLNECKSIVHKTKDCFTNPIPPNY